MASRPLSTKTPSRTARPTRRSTAAAERADRGGPVGTEAAASRTTPMDTADHAWPTPPPFSRRFASHRAAHNSTLLFRGLLLIAAAAALAFTVAALISPPGGAGTGDPTSPDAPPPVVFVQPDR